MILFFFITFSSPSENFYNFYTKKSNFIDELASTLMKSINQSLDSLHKEIHSLRQDIYSLRQEFSSLNHSLRQDIYLLRQEFSSLNHSLHQEFSSLNHSLHQEFSSLSHSLHQEFSSLNHSLRQDIYLLRQEFSSLSHSLNQKFDSLHQSIQAYFTGHKRALKIAYNSSCKIIINMLDNSTIFGCGNLIFVDGKFYVSTNLHVLYDYENSTFPDNITIIFNDMGIMKISGGILIFNTLSVDLALIEALPDSTQQQYALRVSDQYLSLGDSLIGVSYQEDYVSILDCQIIEKLINTSNQGDSKFRTNCGGGPGSSGTGYLNDEGFLVAIHNPSQTYESIRNNLHQDFSKHMSDEEAKAYMGDIFSNLLTNISHLSNNSQNTIYYNNSLGAFNQFYEQIHQEIQIHFRNPRAAAVPSKEIFDLIHNTTSRSLHIKFGDSIYLSSIYPYF